MSDAALPSRVVVPDAVIEPRRTTVADLRRMLEHLPDDAEVRAWDGCDPISTQERVTAVEPLRIYSPDRRPSPDAVKMTGPGWSSYWEIPGVFVIEAGY